MADDETSPLISDGDTGFTLPRGATGFFRPKDGPLPQTDVRAFRAALHAAARAAGGTVGNVEERTYPRTFHTATVTGRAGESVVLCHAHHPWIAFTPERRYWYGEEFLAPPAWARAFTDAGFVVLSREQLAMPLSGLHPSTLTEGEWREARYHDTTTVGGALFNVWD
ncbi:hypothetical protein ACH4OW_29110 [Streptomyces sp. NPDC017056]|uniref:hypothetical protein n=1 Tax=Streptomyces sp. NPDC017056 TaxID=3364973 RepID=UPI0037988238